jgi:excisionase family DNA binding protein
MTRKGAAKTPHCTGPIRVITVREVAAYLHVHPVTIYKLLRRHQIPAFRMGSDWRFHIEEIDRRRLEQDRRGG